MATTSLVTGVNGHLGNNLLRLLLSKGENVIGTVRDLENKKPFQDLDFEPVYADLLDRESLSKALGGVDILYQVAAVFKHWSENPEKDIYEANMTATKNIMEIAAEKGVKKIIYVSSEAAVDHTVIPMTADRYNEDRSNVYYRSKTDSEKLAWEIAKKNNLEMVAVLPSAMIGSECFHLTPTYKTFKLVLEKEVFADTQFYLNWVDVKDVAEGCYLAAQKGKPGERYLLGTEKSVGLTEIVKIAKEEYPELKLKIPPKMPKGVLLLSANVYEMMSKITGKEPMLLKNQVNMYYQVHQDLDISKSVNDLGYNPTPPREVIKNALKYLKESELMNA